MDYKIHNIDLLDITKIFDVYQNGTENSGDSIYNKFDKRIDKKTYRTDLVNAHTFFCDLNNKDLVDIISKYITLNKNEYISNIHYINYERGQSALPHVDTGSSIRTYIFMLSNNYTGGQFFLNNLHIPLQIGDMIEFNANLVHSVSEVENGNREVLVIWVKHSNKNKTSLI